MSPAGHGKRIRTIKETGPRLQCHQLGTGIIQIDVLFPGRGKRTIAQHAVLGVERHVVGNKIRDQGWQTNPEVHILTRLQEARGAERHELRRQAVWRPSGLLCRFDRPALGPHEFQHLSTVERFFT